MVRKPVDNITDIIGQTPVVKLRHQAVKMLQTFM